MKNPQLETLQNLLKIMERIPLHERMTAIEMNVLANYRLYQDEKDEEGMAIYRPLIKVVKGATSMEDLKAAVAQE